jgi:hypothetical protein
MYVRAKLYSYVHFILGPQSSLSRIFSFVFVLHSAYGDPSAVRSEVSSHQLSQNG